MQVDTVHDDVGILEALTKRRPGRNPRDLLAVERIDHHNGRRRIGRPDHFVADAELMQHVKDVGTELDAITDGAELRSAFKHAHRMTPLCQRERRGEAAEAAADNEDGIDVARIDEFSRHP